MNVSYRDIIDIYDNYIYKGCNNKVKIYNFERYKMENITTIYNVFKSNNYVMGNYNIFMIKYPKYRIVMSLNMIDKVINHYIAMYHLMPKLSKYLDIRNVATRKGMGTDYAVKLLKKYININKNKYNKLYALKLDIKKYFYSIDHDILLNMLKKDLDSNELSFISTIINSTDKDYVNKRIISLKDNEIKCSNRKEEIDSIPIYEKGKGLPIGNMTSQFLAIFYLNEIDHYIVHDLKLKYMIRYMDDYVILHHDKEYLNKCKVIIENKINKELKLKLSAKKCRIYDLKYGFDFLGYNFKVNNKTIINISNSSKKNIVKRIKLIDINNFKGMFSSLNNYYNGFKYSNSMYLKRLINRL